MDQFWGHSLDLHRQTVWQRYLSIIHLWIARKQLKLRSKLLFYFVLVHFWWKYRNTMPTGSPVLHHGGGIDILRFSLIHC